MRDNHLSSTPLYRRGWQLAAALTALCAAILILAPRPSVADDQAVGLIYQPVVPIQAPPAPIGPLYGVVFISSAEDRVPGSGRTTGSLEQQYQHGLATGATWNRWPLYWFNIEKSPGAFDWATQDATVRADLTHGLKLNAILLGTPGFYTTDDAVRASRPPRPRPGTLSLDSVERATPVGLYEPIFSDGTDTPGPGKLVNPANKWANFTWLAVNRYKPGGVLAQAEGWPLGVGVTHWEMWNEPDLNIFWDASKEDYARLLKVGYLTAKQADPAAQVLFAGLANNVAKASYYQDILTILAADPAAAQYGFYHDILATHSYFHAWKSWYHVYRALGTMRDFGFEKPIWLNESGVPAWDDYPGPVWDPQSALRATTKEQADYVIQSAFYALFAGADGVFHFQLYDGCGNQPAGTDFPPHNGELCDANGEYQGKPCAGDANGLYTNPTDMSCFRQHPQPASPRLTQAAYNVLTRHVQNVMPYWRKREGAAKACPVENPGGGIVQAPPQEWIAFYRPATQERVVGMWTLCGRAETAVIDATSPDGRATLVFADGRTQPIAAVDGHYTIQLPAATNRNPYPFSNYPNAIYPIGGSPVILIEKDIAAAGG
ncbi:hypothetical protein [Promineifilum sp.]|uniref:hypothetical protein n=1 Tax=Promineifilum sp. TaxID=2664178 RepID=UPI0035B0A88C